MSENPVVSVIMGSQSDWEFMRHSIDTLEKLGIPCESRIISAHRTPDRMVDYVVPARDRGLKVIIAEAECQIAKQRRLRPMVAKALKAGERVVRTRFGVDEDTCTGDHACIRLSGCPSLSVKPNPDPLRKDPVTSVLDSCVGCGLCGEVADAAVLCPSFYRAEIIQNPSALDRLLDRTRSSVIARLQGRANVAGAA